MTDCRRPGPSLYIAVCGRRDAHMPRNVQKDPECSLTWTIKDEVIRKGRAQGLPSIGTMLQEASDGSIDATQYDTDRAKRAHLGWW